MTPPRAPLMPLDDALARLLAQALPLPGVDTMRTFDADGRVLAHDLVSALQVPPLDNSAMDGYALRCADVPQPGTVLPVSQRIPAGRVGTPLQPGTAARIFTGAPVPEGADAVVMQEECSAEGDGHVRVQATPRAGQNIRLAGENITRGSVVLQAGARLTPAALGLAASIGVAELPVARRPRVALFSTGDELAMPGEVAPEQLPPGAIYNSNRFFLHALLQRMGCEVTDMGIVPDRLGATQDALRAASQDHDVILTSGGVSVGEEDHIKPAVQALGQLDLWQIAIKPGKPFAYGRVGPAAFGACNPPARRFRLAQGRQAPRVSARALQRCGRAGPVHQPGLGRTDLDRLGRWRGRQPARPDHCTRRHGALPFVCGDAVMRNDPHTRHFGGVMPPKGATFHWGAARR